MKFKLINPISHELTTQQQILINRGVKLEDIEHYLYPSAADLNEPELLGKDKLDKAVKFIDDIVDNQLKTLIVVDCDCDGYTSSSMLINFLTDLDKTFALNNIKWFLHDDKTHGLKDCYKYAIENNYTRVIVPDAGSNDDNYFKELLNTGAKVLVMDHHLVEGQLFKNDNVNIINNQICDYPNKELSGAGVVYQVLRYYDKVKNTDYSSYYKDLAALGNIGDMMSMLSIETHYIAQEGIKKENIHNPFFYQMVETNKFKLGDTLSPIGIAFYVVPFINSMCRSGTLEEKELLFKSMLKITAFEQVENTGRGHKGEMTNLVEEAVRVAQSVKRRQTKEQDEAVERLEQKIKDNDLLKNKVLLLLVKPEDNINPNIRGLIANKLAAKYQRPCAILTQTQDENGNNIYAGSMRGYTGTGIEDFKSICENAGVGAICVGHQNAAGLSFAKNKVEDFINNTNELLKDISSDIVINCDYIFNKENIDETIIMDIGYLNTLWGQDLQEPLIGLKDIKIHSEDVVIMKEKHLKLIINGIACVKFFATDLIEKLKNIDGYAVIDAVGKANLNEWAGQVSGQILLDNIEIKQLEKWEF